MTAESTMEPAAPDIREHLAAGLPVVSTPMREVSIYGSLISIADSADSLTRYPSCRSIPGRPPNGRRERSGPMSRETWPQKLDLICESLDRPEQNDASG